MHRSAARLLYYVGCFIALVVLASLPKFLGTATDPLRLFERALLLFLFIAVAWFFNKTLHEPLRWSVLSSLFYVEALTAIICAVLLFMQFFHDTFVVLTLLVLLVRSAVQSWLVAHRMTHLRGLVFFTCLFLLVAGELILVFGFAPL